MGMEAAPLAMFFGQALENTQIEPHEEFDEQYLTVTAETLATGDKITPNIDGQILMFQFDRTVPEKVLIQM